MSLPVFLRKPWILGLACVLLPGCVAYHPKPLPDDPDLISAQRMASARAELDAGHDTRAEPFDMVEAVQFALAHNPDLRAQRAQQAIAAAQLSATRPYADPQLTASGDRPASHQPDLVNGFNVGLGYDLQSLFSYAPNRDAAKANARQAKFTLLWQEWQTAQQARMLYARHDAEQKSLALYQSEIDALKTQSDAAQAALARGDIDAVAAGNDGASLADMQTRLGQLQQQHTATAHELSALLGIRPDALPTLKPLAAPETFDAEALKDRANDIARQRPDLLALQAGYASEEARLRKEILAQFPSIGIGVSRARDTSAVVSNGLSISLNFPIFTGNRPAIAQEEATRDQLHAEYRARLASAQIDSDRLLALQQQIETRRREVMDRLPRLRQAAVGATRAFERADIDGRAYHTAQLAWINARIEQIDLERAAWENRIAIEVALGWSPASSRQAQD